MLADIYKKLAGSDQVLTYCEWLPGSNATGRGRPLNARCDSELPRLLNSVDPLDFPHAVLELDRYEAKKAGGGESSRSFASNSSSRSEMFRMGLTSN
jgi:hypothetical protein